MMFGLSFTTHMMALLRLSLHVEIPITDSTRLFLKNLESPLMIALIALSRLLAAYIHVVLLPILIMNMLNNCCMLLMTLCGGMKITALEESADFATLDTEKLFNKLKSHELSRKGRPNHDASLTSKAFVTSTHVGGHVANPTNTTDSSALEFVLSSLCAASDE
jgi:hypothetical protein